MRKIITRSVIAPESRPAAYAEHIIDTMLLFEGMERHPATAQTIEHIAALAAELVSRGYDKPFSQLLSMARSIPADLALMDPDDQHLRLWAEPAILLACAILCSSGVIQEDLTPDAWQVAGLMHFADLTAIEAHIPASLLAPIEY